MTNPAFWIGVWLGVCFLFLALALFAGYVSWHSFNDRFWDEDDEEWYAEHWDHDEKEY